MSRLQTDSSSIPGSVLWGGATFGADRAPGRMTIVVNVYADPLAVKLCLPPAYRRQIAGRQPKPLYDEIRRLQTISEGWDGYDAPAPNLAAIDGARRVLDQAFSNGHLPARILPSAEGGVFMVFSSRGNIEIFNDGSTLAAMFDHALQVWPVNILDAADLSVALERLCV